MYYGCDKSSSVSEIISDLYGTTILLVFQVDKKISITSHRF